MTHTRNMSYIKEGIIPQIVEQDPMFYFDPFLKFYSFFIDVSDILVGLSPFIGNIQPPLDTLSLSLSYLNCINITELN